jgi:hypothetical protein
MNDEINIEGPVIMDGELTAGDLTKAVNILGNCHIAGQLTAGNL